MCDDKLVSLPDLARMLGVGIAVVRRLARAGVLEVVDVGPANRPHVREEDYTLVRLLVDLDQAGFSIPQLRDLVQIGQTPGTAANASRALMSVIDRALPELSTRLDRLRRLREDLIRASTGLQRCGACYKPPTELRCRDCSTMPVPPPRLLDAFFLPRKK